MANKTKNRMTKVPVYTESIKAITHIPSWALDSEETGEKVKNSQAAYKLVPLFYRSLRLRCDALSTVPVKVWKGSTQVDWQFGMSPAKFLRLTEAAKLLAGASYWLKLPNPFRPVDLDFINPFTMKQPKIQADGSLQFTQVINGREASTWNDYDIVYIRDFWNPDNDIGAGVAAGQVALEDAGLMHYMSRFASKFFESGAMPLTIVAIDGRIEEQERKRVEGFFKRNMTGISNAWRVLAMKMSGTMKPEVITPKIKDMALDSNYTQAAKNIEYAFGIPDGMLRSESNRASAEEHRKSFWQDTVRPSGQATEDEMNEQLFKPIGLRVELCFEDLDVFQTDESERAGSLNELVTAGVPLDIAMEILGYDLDDDQLKTIVDLVNKPEPAPIVVNTNPDTQDPQNDISQELGKWQRMAQSRIRAGKPIRDFSSNVIPEDLHTGISQALQEAKTLADVDEIFTDLPTQAPGDPAELLLKGISLGVDALQADQERSKPINVIVHNHPGEKPVVNISQEAQKAQEPPIVNVTVEPSLATVENIINIPEQAAPNIENVINIPEQTLPDINIVNEVTVPDPKRSVVVRRDGKGNVTGLDQT